MNELKKLKKAIENANFSEIELAEFREDPASALMAGAVIGARICLGICQQALDKLSKDGIINNETI